jgi:hypothetical protein
MPPLRRERGEGEMEDERIISWQVDRHGRIHKRTHQGMSDVHTREELSREFHEEEEHCHRPLVV